MILEKLIHFISYIKQDCLYNCNIFSNKYLEIYPNRVYNIKRKGGNHMEENRMNLLERIQKQENILTGTN